VDLVAVFSTGLALLYGFLSFLLLVGFLSSARRAYVPGMLKYIASFLALALSYYYLGRLLGSLPNPVTVFRHFLEWVMSQAGG